MTAWRPMPWLQKIQSDDLNCLGTMYLPAKNRMISNEPCLEYVLIAGPSAALQFVRTYDEIM